ncbi:MAG: hypothetical protein E6J13_04930 [Chloroflexi bacterium]|nr:MAG: hypothetical protein E6J13_04930 [Chloroflexota bacterium]
MPRLAQLCGVFLVSAAGLLFQFAQTRLFSATLGYHLSFLVVSGALLGVAIGATAAATVDRARQPITTSWLAVGAAMSILAALVIETQLDPLVVGVFATSAAAYVLGVPPVLLASWIIVRSLRQAPAVSGTIYAFDLAGAATGGVVGYLAIGALGDQALYGVASAFCLVAATTFLTSSASRIGWRRLSAVAAAAGLVVLLTLWGEVLAPPRPGPLKSTGYDLAEGMTRDIARWDPLARVEVMRFGSLGDPVHYAFLIDKSVPTESRPPSLAMELDMGALTPIIATTSASDLAVLDASILGAPYELASRQSVLVIGPGGGIDVMTALRHGAQSVTAVEVNRAVVELMRGRYASYSGGTYADPRVHLVEDEARSFVRRSADHYDLVVMTVVDSFAALSSGAYALTESYLYTEQAMADYLEHLAPGGTLAVGRWYRDPPVEIVRTFNIAVAGLRALGNSNPAGHIAVMRHGNFGLLLIGDRVYGAADVQRLREFATAHGFELAFDPLHPGGPFISSVDEAPATDDRPFFFDTVPLSAVLSGQASLPFGYGILGSALLLALALGIGLAIVPLYAQARRAGGRAVPPGTLTSIAIGFGFIATELVLLQRLTLYLGQPSLALAVGIAALLGGAACGSAASSRVRGGARLPALLSALGLLVTLALLPLVTDATLAAPLAVRVAVALIAAVLVGLPLGSVFPNVVAEVGGIDTKLVSWVWAVNGTASVVGAVVATAVALGIGFSGLGAAAVLCYGLAALSTADLRRFRFRRAVLAKLPTLAP